MNAPPPQRDAEKGPSGKNNTAKRMADRVKSMLNAAKKIRPSFGTDFSARKT